VAVWWAVFSHLYLFLSSRRSLAASV